MSEAWLLSQLEFHLVWQAIDRDRMPFPIEFRNDAEVLLDFERECAAARTKLVALLKDEPDLHRALQALARPKVRVEMFGIRRDGRDRMVRMHTGIDDGVGAVLVQEPGAATDLDAAGDIRVYLHTPAEALRRMVSLLPAVRPGTAHGVSINRLDMVAPETWSAADARSPREQVNRFLRRPYRTYLEIKVDQGPALDGWQQTGRHLHVVDFEEEGRYLLSLGNRIEAKPLTAAELLARIQRAIDRTLDQERTSAWS
ncbi:ESX secretion-associated protein EspG [Nocardia macrotermitis]|uniref:EspG family protein n=1 Tax=Nocardia macrotermitis TaxID=2585198 RepID=A0A7K0DDQ0_9NOCA|nr:ESX secretion-associated protein EspG [Nocardia macrotermitis]MQY23930.1 hypothetical protein [Nocardia macrotermitis]